jgi:hypothetical protein
MVVQVKRKQLALLEFIMKSCPREDIAMMARRCVLSGFSTGNF